ncbi:hypothetical protein PY650_10680 [Rhizobium calliandrae]|uniref:Uncharacterized protein n=1 Tax=Rhizobium calliandrae TaxID=1312182 RepID=A0ABT7KBY3_9HYPH|nr:hypothetical protein [Rhizobium calliandrae]MDL2406125.1 hypothetical protein [Rhizobium calliandrae]
MTFVEADVIEPTRKKPRPSSVTSEPATLDETPRATANALSMLLI